MIVKRLRRNRKNSSIRNLLREHSLSTNDLIMPLFVVSGKAIKQPITSMPGQYRFSIDFLVKEVKELFQLGIQCVSLFPCIEEKLKSKDARESYRKEGLNQQAVKAIKDALPQMLVMTDVALDPYSIYGHDGLYDEKTGEVLNDETLEVLGKMALVQAEAGSDILGPSDMMDGRIGYLRKYLDHHGCKKTAIMSYTAKYASCFYGPFREALDSKVAAFGDKKTYQIDIANKREAVRQARLDEEEGADMLMIKPALAYLDIISEIKNKFQLPVVAYNVSGEYVMIKAACEKGWLDFPKVVVEVLTSFKRAGADVILTYFSKEVATILREEK